MKILYKCEICGQDIGYYYPSCARRTCSSACRKSLTSILSSGSKNGNFKHGKFCTPNYCAICGVGIDHRSKRCVACKKDGNKYKTKQGYVLVKKRHHPNRNHHNYVFEHIMVMADHLQRPIQKGEIVHHKDFVKDNNAIDNLHLYESHAAHGKCTRGIFQLVKQLLCMRILEFKNGEYCMNQKLATGELLVSGEPL